MWCKKKTSKSQNFFFARNPDHKVVLNTWLTFYKPISRLSSNRPYLYSPLHIRHSLLKHFSTFILLPLQRCGPGHSRSETFFPQPHCPWPESSVSWPSHPSEVQLLYCDKHSSNKQGSTSLAAPLQISPFQRVFEIDMNNDNIIMILSMNLIRVNTKTLWNSETLCLDILSIFSLCRNCKLLNIRTILPIHQNHNMVWWSILRLNCTICH